MFDALTKDEIAQLAKALKLEPAALMAVAEVESAGVASGWNGLPVIRWEGHYFYRLLNKLADKVKLNLAVSQHLASVHAGGIANPKSQEDRYILLGKAEKIDEDAALASCSWGIGQVMGENWKDLGFKNVSELVNRCKQSVAGQVDVMGRFIRANHLIDELQDHRWRDFALAYNGPSGVAAGYDKLISAAYSRYTR